MAEISDAAFPEWFGPFVPPARYKTVYGGRSSSKTYTLALWLIKEAASRYVRCACARQFQKSIEQSVKPTLEWAIYRLGLQNRFSIGKYEIKCPSTKSHFFFAGLARNIENVRGWHDVTDVWFEEAQMLPPEFAKEVLPTIMRGEHETTAWFTWNPRFRTDYVWQRFIVHPQQGDVALQISWIDNPWHTSQAEMERRIDRDMNPHLYAHIWEGAPDDGASDKLVLAYSALRACVDAHKAGLHDGASSWPAHSGLDIADGGKDRNCYVGRRGPLIDAVVKWHSATPGFMSPTARRADGLAREREDEAMYYDAGGVGAPIREHFANICEDLGAVHAYRPTLFGGAVAGQKRIYDRRKTNADAFANRAAQLGFAVRLRAHRTVQLLNEEGSVRPDKCLFIDPEIPRLHEYLASLTQPQWYESSSTGKITIDKRGDLAGESPDEYDATVMAFARDSEEGLRAF